MSPFQDPLPGVPRIDSPFFERFFGGPAAGDTVTPVARDLRMKGFAVIDFPEPDFAAIAARISANLHPRYDWERWRSHPPTFESRIQDAWHFDPDVKRLAVNESILELLEALYGRKPFAFQTLNFSVGSQQRIHSDSVHFSSYPAHFMCGVWVALEDVDESNGPLIYHPGSHRWPIYTNEHIGVNVTALPAGGTPYAKYEDMWQDLVTAHEAPQEKFLARKGQAIIWSANLLHGGDRHINPDRTRWSQVTHYYFEGCAYHTPMLSDPYTGRIFFREPVDIKTGRVIRNEVSSVPTPDWFIRQTAAPAARAPFAKRALRRLGRMAGVGKR